MMLMILVSNVALCEMKDIFFTAVGASIVRLKWTIIVRSQTTVLVNTT